MYNVNDLENWTGWEDEGVPPGFCRELMTYRRELLHGVDTAPSPELLEGLRAKVSIPLASMDAAIRQLEKESKQNSIDKASWTQAVNYHYLLNYQYSFLYIFDEFFRRYERKLKQLKGGSE